MGKPAKTRQSKARTFKAAKAAAVSRGRVKATKPPAPRWSQAVTENSNALDLESGVFTHADPKKIASSLRKSAERSRRHKGSAFQSAMSMLTFYMNRAGRLLSQERKVKLNRAKTELRKAFGRE